MPRYFFETNDGSLQSDDDKGIELPDAEAARRLAQETLPDMARDQLPDGESREFTVSVRNEAGLLLYSVRLSLAGQWHVATKS